MVAFEGKSIRLEVFLRLGILGGTFDPIHFGHLRMAEEACEELHLEKVCLIPSASPPHKTEEVITTFDHRLAMVKSAVTDDPLLDVMDLEGRRTGLSYSIETLIELHEAFRPDLELFFILGADAFLDIKTWKDYQRLFDYAHFFVVHRAGFSRDTLHAFLMELGLNVEKTGQADLFVMPSGNQVIFKTTTLLDISSTSIRKIAAQGRSMRFLVPDPVRRYIIEKGLYRNHADAR
ncbi:MAG: nicotinate-nucleotide adenylyltransferase [Desulfatiglans sp.]|jgi:nicotinate-nucleotide adenylyltransferase|nr:nicotinate-nucleotide adenylyltransferase [Desulfatiglans sp.]